MNFTREPIIETIVTPKEGYKLVVRNSKGPAQEEHFVDSLEIVSFSNALFFRSTERPKCFLVPVTDYEVLEVREARMALKTSPIEKGIKIGGGKEISRPAKEHVERAESDEAVFAEESDGEPSELPEGAPTGDARYEKKRDRRRHRKRKGSKEERDDSQPRAEGHGEPVLDDLGESYSDETSDEPIVFEKSVKEHSDIPAAQAFSSLIPPPLTLISDTIAQYRGNAEYRKAFFHEPEESEASEAIQEQTDIPQKPDVVKEDEEEHPTPPSFTDE